jgi:hypothetical protein
MVLNEGWFKSRSAIRREAFFVGVWMVSKPCNKLFNDEKPISSLNHFVTIKVVFTSSAMCNH